MKRENIGIVRKIDCMGRIVIPMEFRKEIGVKNLDEVEINLVLVDNKEKVIEIKKKGE